MNIGILMPAVVCFAMLCGLLVMPGAIRKKSEAAGKQCLIASAIGLVLTVVVLVLALIKHGEPILAFVVPGGVILMAYAVSLMIIMYKNGLVNNIQQK